MTHWPFLVAAYAITASVLLGYWWRVERRIGELEAATRLRGSGRDRGAHVVGQDER